MFRQTFSLAQTAAAVAVALKAAAVPCCADARCCGADGPGGAPRAAQATRS